MSVRSFQHISKEPRGRMPWIPLHAELALWLPDRPSVRREILDFGLTDSEWILRPDGSGAEASLRFNGQGLMAALRGPERADLELDFVIPEAGLSLTLWAVTHGPRADMSIWDTFGRLQVPDVLARGTDAEALQLDPGRYMLAGSVQQRSSILVGIGVDPIEAHDAGARRAAG